jgi:hypothetical protein
MGSVGSLDSGDRGSGTEAGSGWKQREKGEGIVMNGGGRGVILLSSGGGSAYDILLRCLGRGCW